MGFPAFGGRCFSIHVVVASTRACAPLTVLTVAPRPAVAHPLSCPTLNHTSNSCVRPPQRPSSRVARSLRKLIATTFCAIVASVAQTEDNMAHGSDDGEEAAPSEILAEFLSAIMSGKYAVALHYCRLILSYEPQNATARGFCPLLEERTRETPSRTSTTSPSESAFEDISTSSSIHSRSTDTSSQEDVHMEEEQEEDTEDESSSSFALEDAIGKLCSSSDGCSDESDTNGNLQPTARIYTRDDIHNENTTEGGECGDGRRQHCTAH